MPPPDTADSTMDIANPFFLGVLAVMALTVLLATGRWLWLPCRLWRKRRLMSGQTVELTVLSISLAVFTATVGYSIFLSSPKRLPGIAEG